MNVDPLTTSLLGLFVFLWVAVGAFLSCISGWAALAEHYRTDDAFAGRRWRFRSARLGRANYNGVLTVGANALGLHLSLLFPFRSGHPPLLIPWSDVTSEPSTKRWLMPVVGFRFRRVPSVRLELPDSLAEDIAAESGGRFTLRVAA